MSRPHRAAAELIDEARNHIASCLDLPKPKGDSWAQARRDVTRASRSVGQGVRTAMETVQAELDAVEE